MAKSIERRIESIEQKMGGDTTVISGIVDLVVCADKVKRGIDVGKVKFDPKLVEIIRRKDRACREDKDNEQEH